VQEQENIKGNNSFCTNIFIDKLSERLMKLLDALNIGTALTAGAIKGVSDEMNIDIHYFSYILPAVGIAAFPLTSFLMENNNSDIITDTSLGIIYTGIGYTFGRTITNVIKHASK
jgi:hypothetical protein